MIYKNYIRREIYFDDKVNGSQKDGQFISNIVCIKLTHIHIFKAIEDD